MTTPFNYDNKPPIVKWLLVLLAILVVALFIIAAPGCRVIKKINSKKTDSVNLSKKENSLIDSSKTGTVTKTNTAENWEWWKTTVIPGQNRDTNIYNFHNYPSSPAPATIIYEGGNGERQTQTTDSSWKQIAIMLLQKQTDSSHLQQQEKAVDNKTETKGLGLWMIVAIAVASGLAPGILKKIFSFLFSGYTFVNPVQKKAV